MGVLRYLVLAFLAAGAALVIAAPPASACSCASGPERDVRKSVGKADAAFVGVYQGRNDPLAGEGGATGGRIVVNHFSVESVQKGSLGSTVDVESAAEASACGLQARAGERVGLILTRTPGGYRSSLCASVEPDALVKVGPGKALGTPIAAVVAVLALVSVVVAAAVGPWRVTARGA